MKANPEVSGPRIVQKEHSHQIAADGSSVKIEKPFSAYADTRWLKKKLETMQRDGWRCARCAREDRPLRVHHKRYGSTLWGVRNSDLQTLCDNCHALLGKHTKAGIWYADDGSVALEHCPACGSTDLAAGLNDVACNRCSHKVGPVGELGIGWAAREHQDWFGKAS